MTLTRHDCLKMSSRQTFFYRISEPNIRASNFTRLYIIWYWVLDLQVFLVSISNTVQYLADLPRLNILPLRYHLNFAIARLKKYTSGSESSAKTIFVKSTEDTKSILLITISSSITIWFSRRISSCIRVSSSIRISWSMYERLSKIGPLRQPTHTHYIFAMIASYLKKYSS